MRPLTRWNRWSLQLSTVIATGLLLSSATPPASAAGTPVTLPESLKALGVESVTWEKSKPAIFKLTNETLAKLILVGDSNNTIGIINIEGSAGWKDVNALKDGLENAEIDGVYKITSEGNRVFVLPTPGKIASDLKLSGIDFETEGTGDGRTLIINRADGLAEISGVNYKDVVISIDGLSTKNVDVARYLAWKGLTSGRVQIRLQPRGADATEQRVVTIPSIATPVTNFRGLDASATGPHITFPEFVGRGKNSTPTVVEAADKSVDNEVITARVELYYFRDAHRVAQLVNRNSRSYSAAAVTLQERAAEDAREITDAAKSRRREAEFKAEEAAKELRIKKNELARLVSELRASLTEQTNLAEENKSLLSRKKALEKERGALDTNSAAGKKRMTEIDDELSAVGDRIAEIAAQDNTQKTAMKAADYIKPQEIIRDTLAEISRLEQEVSTLKLKEQQAVEAEEKAAKDQFRREVSAAKVDPDTYAPGDPNSIDPVSQVSISVIGEGVLHLRGPRAGVVRIREMIDQIDHPVGQVKIGIMTVQLNGESGARMDNTLRRMEGHLSRGRFLTYVSEQMFKRAVSEVSSLVAGKAMNVAVALSNAQLAQAAAGSYRHADHELRWRAYLTEFYGEDFINELGDVNENASIINPLNKLIALSSADSMTLAEAMFVAALAKVEYRQQIVERFKHYITCELPVMDASWVETNRIKKGWDPRWWDGTCCKPDQVIAHGRKTYRFDAITSFFRRTYAEPHSYETEEDVRSYVNDRMNAMQREVVKLVQGLTIEQAVSLKRQALIEKKALVCRAGYPLAPHQLQLVDSEIASLTEQHLAAVESLRGRKAALDRLIKQAVIAMEDDVYAQFYNPALERIRGAAEEWDVELGSVERTTVLTNNRAFGKVAPQATYEFDLPKRDILVAEALKAAYAMHKDLGPLLADPEFATLAKMFSGQSLTTGTLDGRIQNVLPSGSTAADQQYLLQADASVRPQFGTELEKLIPDPAIYKFETGTGFDVRPVVQPDGQSVVFDFNYMYTTDLLEPTSPDERNLGRVKRHFVNTEVQLGNLEWREISRYEVSLKAARNARGVPLLEDIPIAGLAFRPLPQAKKSIQKNIIVGQAAVYPTIQDLLGLRPSGAAQFDFGTTTETFEKLKRDAECRSQQAESILDQTLREAKVLPSVSSASQEPADPVSGASSPDRSERPVILPLPQQRQADAQPVPGVSRYQQHRPIQPVRYEDDSTDRLLMGVIQAGAFTAEQPATSPGSRKQSRSVPSTSSRPAPQRVR